VSIELPDQLAAVAMPEVQSDIACAPHVVARGAGGRAQDSADGSQRRRRAETRAGRAGPAAPATTYHARMSSSTGSLCHRCFKPAAPSGSV
jgi:hypothetical protein